MVELSNEELLARLRSDEDHFTERKTFRDTNGWLKTAVAFANSAPIDWPAILFVGVTRKGQIESPTPNLDQLQMTLGKELARAYPPLYHLPKIVTDETAGQCLAVLVPGSRERPHFTGKSYVRVGSESREASDDQFQELIAQHLSKVRELLRWRGKGVTVLFIHLGQRYAINLGNQVMREATILDCNQFYVTFKNGNRSESLPLSNVELTFDHDNDRLMLQIRCE